MDERLKLQLETGAKEKEAWRQARAKLPFPEKIRILVKLQERQAPILAARGKKPIIWQIEE